MKTASWNRFPSNNERKARFKHDFANTDVSNDRSKSSNNRQMTLLRLKSLVAGKSFKIDEGISDNESTDTSLLDGARNLTNGRKKNGTKDVQGHTGFVTGSSMIDLGTSAATQGGSDSPKRHKNRLSSTLHGPQTANACESKVGIDSEPSSFNEDSELLQFKHLIKGEVGANHIKQILNCRLLLNGANAVREQDICGLASTKKLIRDKIISPILRPELHTGLYSAPKGILFFGPPGTGKTTLAKWLATESGACFFNMSASSLISKYHGETEILVRTLFLVAETCAPSIVFMDEIDALIGKRGDKEEDTTLRMKNQLLQMMDGVANQQATVVVVGATNRPQALEEAALRRLSKRIYIPLPDLESRTEHIRHILEKHAQSMGNSDANHNLNDQELREVAGRLDGYNGSDLQAVCIKAAEFVYDEVLQKYGSIKAVPGVEVFRLPTAHDLMYACDFVNKSSSEISANGYKEWASTLGCL